MSRSEEGGLPFEPAHSGSEAPREDQAAAGEVEECQEATLEPDAGASGDDSSRAMAAGAGADSLADSQEGDQPAAKEDCTAEPVPGSGQHKGASAAVSGASSGAELETAAGDRAQGAAEACAGSSGCGEERTSDAAADEQEHNGAAGEQPACASAAADEEGVEEGGAEEGSDAAAAAGEGEQQASEEREGPEAREQAEPSLDAQPVGCTLLAGGCLCPCCWSCRCSSGSPLQCCLSPALVTRQRLHVPFHAGGRSYLCRRCLRHGLCLLPPPPDQAHLLRAAQVP